jgi:polysaccharide export outer membrane protein
MNVRRAVAVAICAVSVLGSVPALGVQPYLIGGGDSLQVNVWKNPELSQAVVVRPDGMITMPLIRDVQASGKTAMELAKTIEEKLAAFVNAPNVTVTVAAATNYRVYTRGAVTDGMFLLAAQINAMQLLVRAGGPAEDADLGAAFILRGGTRIPVDPQPRHKAGVAEAESYPELLPDDTLVIPRDPTRRVLVVGEIREPKSLPFREGMTVLDAFVAAGGGTDYADLDSVRVVRLGADRRQAEIEVDLARMLKKGDLSKNLTLVPGDVVVVPR